MGDMIANLLVNLSGALIFLFIFWKKLKEDHASEIIFSSAYTVLAGILAGYLLSLNFFPEWFFWSEVIGILIGYVISIYKFRVRVFETLDSLVISLLPWLSLTFLKDSVVNSSLISFISFVAVLLFIFIYHFMDMRYKRFTWYRSGKIGFSGLATLTLFFITRAAIATSFGAVLSFVSVYEPYISGALAFMVALVIFNLSRKEE